MDFALWSKNNVTLLKIHRKCKFKLFLLKNLVKNHEFNVLMDELISFDLILRVITSLESNGLSLFEQMNIYTNVYNKISTDCIKKINQIINKNPDLKFFMKMYNKFIN